MAGERPNQVSSESASWSQCELQIGARFGVELAVDAGLFAKPPVHLLTDGLPLGGFQTMVSPRVLSGMEGSLMTTSLKYGDHVRRARYRIPKSTILQSIHTPLHPRNTLCSPRGFVLLGKAYQDWVKPMFMVDSTAKKA